MAEFISALEYESGQRKDYLGGEEVKTIYFGGGTPSVLHEKELITIMNFLHKNFSIVPGAEITFESNPDDLSVEYLHSLKQAGINRLSIGIQSFNDVHLKRMNRRHNAAQAERAVKDAFDAGFTNLSADLIYGLPEASGSEWKASLRKIFKLPVVHLSAYHLTYHKGTPFYTWLKKGTLKEISEEMSLRQFHSLLDETRKAGFEQYEISNFARNQLYSEHNKGYWFGEKYLGLGPSAHSYNGFSRRWNVAHLNAYLGGLQNKTFFEEELLTEKDKYNEFILTRIRTQWGILLTDLQDCFGRIAAEAFRDTADRFVQSGKMAESEGRYFLTREGMFVSDDLISSFIIL